MLNLLSSGIGCSLRNLDVEHLPWEIPLIERRIDIQSFVALQTNQLCSEHGSQDFGHLRLAYARFPFQENGLFQFYRQKDDSRQGTVADIIMGSHSLLQGFNRMKFHTDIHPLSSGAFRGHCRHQALHITGATLDKHLTRRQGRYMRHYAF